MAGPRPGSGPPSACALEAGDHAVVPGARRSAAQNCGVGVVDRQLLAPRLRAILAREPVPPEDVPAAEGDRVRRNAVVLRRHDHLGDAQAGTSPGRTARPLEERAGPSRSTNTAGSRRDRRSARSAATSVSERAPEATPTGCQARFKTSVGRVKAVTTIFRLSLSCPSRAERTEDPSNDILFSELSHARRKLAGASPSPERLRQSKERFAPFSRPCQRPARSAKNASTRIRDLERPVRSGG